MSTQQQKFGRTWLCSAIAIIPFAASCWFSAAAPAESPVLGERRGPSLVFDQYLVNFGDGAINPGKLRGPRGAKPGDAVEGLEIPFAYRNVGDTEIRIQSLMPSCGCLQPHVDSKIIPPGAYGRLILPVRTANEKPGPHEYLVKVLYDDGNQHEVDLALKVVLAEKQVKVEPKALWFYQSGNKATTESIWITDYRDKTFNITGIKCSSDLWTVEKTSDLKISATERRIQLDVTLKANTPPGRHRAIIHVETDDPQFGRIEIPIGCQGMESQELTMQAIPNTIVLLPTPEGTIEATTVLRAEVGKPAKIESIKTYPSFVKATYETNDRNETVLRVSAEFEGEKSSKSQRAIVTVQTQGAAAPLTIPVVIPAQEKP